MDSTTFLQQFISITNNIDQEKITLETPFDSQNRV